MIITNGKGSVINIHTVNGGMTIDMSGEDEYARKAVKRAKEAAEMAREATLRAKEAVERAEKAAKRSHINKGKPNGSCETCVWAEVKKGPFHECKDGNEIFCTGAMTTCKCPFPKEMWFGDDEPVCSEYKERENDEGETD